MELCELRYFLATAEALSFRKAAEGLFISQPALSRRIAGLEKDLGVRLFRRDRRGVELTEAGERMLEQAKQVLDTAHRAVTMVRAVPGDRRPAIVIGLSANAAGRLLTPLLVRLHDEWPSVRIDLPPGEVSSELSELRSGELDVVLGYLPATSQPGCEIVPLWEFEVGMLVPETHPAARVGICDASTFGAERIIAPVGEFGCFYRDALLLYCSAVHMDTVVESSTKGHPHTIASVEATVATRGGLGFYSAALSGQAPVGTAAVRLSPPPPPCVVSVARRADDHSPIVSHFIDLARGSRRIAKLHDRPGTAEPVGAPRQLLQPIGG
jgi:DNA-binding transcriptional LysR family regulator